ncbi:MAG: hypothetical protein RLZZ436_587 [Planctomycetota bacterium]|jgi:hypothetical protein
MLRSVFSAVSLLSALFLVPALLAAQDAEPAPDTLASGRIIGKVWYTGVRPEDSFAYLQKVREELQMQQPPILINTVGRSMSGLMGPRVFRAKNNAPGKPEENSPPQLSGVLFVLETRPEVTLQNPVSFELCESLEEFTELVKQQHSQMGSMGELEGSDNQYTLTITPRRFTAPQPAPMPGDGNKETRTLSVVIAVSPSSAPGADPRALVPESIKTYFRYHDGVMYSSRSNALFSLTLPERQSLLLDDENAAMDLFADFDLSQVPADFRQAFRTALESQVSVFLQRFDSEEAGQYALRRVLAEGRFELLKSALFDIDRARFSLQLSPAPGQPVVSRLRIQARPGTPLASGLALISSRSSQLSSLHDDRSPLLVSGTLAIPELLRPFASTLVQSAALRLKETSGDSPSAPVIIEDLAQSLQQTIDSGVLDAAVCLRGSVKDGLVPCAALRLESAETFLNALDLLLQITGARDYVTVQPGTVGDYRMLSISAEDTPVPFADGALPLRLHLAATGSWLWMTLGEDRAISQLQELTAASQESLSQNGRAVPLRIRLNLDGWLGQAADPLSEVPARWLQTLERWLQVTTAPKIAFSINGQDPNSTPAGTDKFNSFAAKALTPGDASLDFSIRTAESELLVEAEFGRGIARLAVAQFLDAQTRMFEGVRLQFSTPDGKGGVRLQLGGPGAGEEKKKSE